MSDQPGHDAAEGPVPDLSAEQEADVRRLLAQARHDEPLPPEVGTRLDGVLAQLAREGPTARDEVAPGAPEAAPVVDLAARRRRRNAAALLASAAAVIVAGFGIGQVIDVGAGQGAGDSQTAAETPDRESAGAAGGSAADSGEAGSAAPEGAPGATLVGAAPLELTSGDLADDVTRELETRPDVPATRGVAPPAGAGYACPPAPAERYGDGELFPALLDGQPAVLALRPPAGATQQADVLACGTADPLASATIAAR